MTELYAAVAKVIEKAPPLKKTERNSFADYKYVPIDQFYSSVPRLAAGEGLSWSIRATEGSLVGKSLHCLAELDLAHSSGEVVKGYASVPIILPVTGGQTAGILLSYADKVLMRAVFKLVTGENFPEVESAADGVAIEDADAMPAEPIEEAKVEIPADVQEADDPLAAILGADVPLDEGTEKLVQKGDDETLDLIVATLEQIIFARARTKAALDEIGGAHRSIISALDSDRQDAVRKSFTKIKGTLM